MKEEIVRPATSCVIMENHDGAYYSWKSKGYKNMIVIHIDAHLDVLSDSASRIHFGNYLHRAIKEGIVKELYWVIPGDRERLIADFIIIKKIFSSLYIHEQKQNLHNKLNLIQFSYQDGIIKVSLYGISIFICTLGDLPIIEKEVLLDIDVDFFIIDRLKNNSNLTNIGKRKLWIRENKFSSKIRAKLKKVKLTTIAYSVNEGYTPLVFKTVGDVLTQSLGYVSPNIKAKLLAGKYYRKFRLAFSKGNVTVAKTYFDKCTKLNPIYLIPENTYGGLFLKNKEYSKAEREFSQMTSINKDDHYSLMGLGVVSIYMNKLSRARRCFATVLKSNPNNELALLYLGAIEYKEKKYSASLVLLAQIEKLNPNNFYSKYIPGKIYTQQGARKLSEEKLKNAMQTGLLHDIPLALEELID